MMDKQLSRHNLLFSLGGLALNVALVWLTSVTGLPLYLDCLGTAIVAALCGGLPGIAVGFFSNLLSSALSLSVDPLTLYYGILSILIALAVTLFSYRGWLRSLATALPLVLILALIGGGLGSLLTWMLYGFSFGDGITAPMALALYRKGFTEAAAQLCASLAIDLMDKAVTVALLMLFLRFVPYGWIRPLPMGALYDRSKPFAFSEAMREKPYRKHSLRTKMVALITVAALVFSAAAIATSLSSFRQMLYDEYGEKCANVARMASVEVDGDQIDAYIASGGESPDYLQVEKRLYQMLNKVAKIQYIYVYRIEKNGCRVVFDLDSGDVAGCEPGTLVPFDSSFSGYVPLLQAGETIPTVISNDAYGWLMTAYEPIFNGAGKCVAYACADIQMTQINNILFTFAIRLGALLFGAFILVALLSLWYDGRVMLKPIELLVERTRTLDYAASDDCVPAVATGDELESLYDSICDRDRRIAGYIREIRHKNLELTQLHRNIIFSLASMTESRDENTGNHIKRTAEYVRAIAGELKKTGCFAEELTDESIQKMYEAAPLHDIGKIKISDMLLNKPGKLTPEEFQVMQTHTTIGREILHSSLEGISEGGSLLTAMDMALSHHEWWNGKGYPQGLEGEEIPLCARIMAVSDVFDALVSKRSYKEAMPFPQALEIIEQESGSHFDPRVVQAFLSIKEEAQRIMRL